jgi:hypothetical protein
VLLQRHLELTDSFLFSFLRSTHAVDTVFLNEFLTAREVIGRRSLSTAQGGDGKGGCQK